MFMLRSRFRKTLFVASIGLVVVAATIAVVTAATWTDNSTASGTRSWTGFACSSDCSKILAADSSSTSANLYRSTDAGVSWTAVTNGGAALQKRWKHVASSSNGTILLASELSGDLWYSTDSGANWTDVTSVGAGSWTGVDMSDDGTVMVAIANTGGGKVGFWKSTDTGANWTNPSGLGSLTPNAIACSSDCSKIVVGMYGNNIYTSTDTGANWTNRTGSSGCASSGIGCFWTSVTSSADGTKLAGTIAFGGNVFTSTDSGANWTSQSGAGTGSWTSISSSSDGATLIAVINSGAVKVSTNSGVNWTTESGPGTLVWQKAVTSADGSYWVVGGTNTGIWTAGNLPVSAPTVTASSPSSVTTTTATFNGNITSTGNENPTTRGFHYATDAYYTANGNTYNTTSSTSGSYSTGAYTASITGLVCNTTYHYEAFATNTGGTGDSTDVSFTTSACPVSPTTTTGTATSFTYGSVTIGGNITNTGGENPTSRYIEYGLTVSYGSQSAADTGSFSTGAFTERVVGLAAGTTYHYRACSTNGAGTGCGSDSTFTTYAAPGQPTSLSATAGYTQATLGWTAPASSGDYAITDYLIEYKLSADSTWTVYPDGTSTATSATVTALANGSLYNFRVSAMSYAGAGTASSTANTTPSSTPTEPNAPSNLAGTGASGQVSLTWSAPNNTGGSALTDYVVQYKTVTATSYTTYSDGVSTTAAATVTGLTNGTPYTFRVAATNGVGTSSYSSTVTVGVGSAIYRHILNTGQSLAEGVNSTPALSTTQPYSNKSLSTSPIAGLSAPLIPLIEGVVARESPASGRANSLSAAMAGNPVFIDTIHALGGTAYSGIKKGGSTSVYANGQTQASVARTQTIAAGAYYLPFGVTITHGETDQINGTTQAAYAGYMADMQADYENDWNALTGLSQTLPLFETQANTNSVGYIATAQFDAHRDNPGKVILVGPRYHLAYGAADHLHLTNTASKILGEMYAKVMKKVLVDGETWDPLMPVSVTRSGTTVTIDFHIPYGTLAIDTTNMAARDDYGFEFVQTGGSAISITGVSLADSNRKIELTLSGVPDGTSPRIRYAWSCANHPDDNAYTQCGDPTDGGAIGGNIRDTDTTTSPSSAGTGTALYDWLVTFDEAITEPTHVEAPTSLSAVTSNGQVALTWEEPENEGGASLSDYVIEYKTAAASSWSTFSDGTSTATAATVTSLSNGTLYEFRVSGVTSLGRGDPSSAVYATPAGVPDAPTSLSGTGGNTQVSLTWTAPAAGGSAITDYIIEYKISTDGSWSTFSDGTSDATSAVVTGLTNNTTYNFRVSAVNTSGTSSASTTANATTAGVPDAPTSLAATPGNTQMALSWTAPAANGSAITDYVVEFKLAADVSWTTFSDGTSTATSATVTGLTNGSSYNFRVSATNAIGTSSVSSTETATPATTPGTPTSLAATRGNAEVSLIWVAPAANGGASVTDYVVEFKLTADASWTTFSDGTSTATSATVTSLTNGSSYDFRVSAVNTAGTGSASSTATATPATTPDAPTSLAATRGNTQVALSWTAPASDGGDAVTDYLVEYKLSGDLSWTTFTDGTSTLTSATVTGLTNGSAYNFRVSAVNTVGTSTASGTANATPSTTPGIPTSLAATRGNTQVSLVWVAPSSIGGASITDYVIEFKLSADSSWTTFSDGTSAATAATVTSLTNGSAYDFRVSATNTAGTGSVSVTASATPATTPGAPASLTATARNTEVNLVWTTPASTGGDSITDYLIEYKLSADGSWSTFSDDTSTATAVTVTGLTNDELYNFRVSAVNTVGTGSASSTANATPTSPVTPNAPTALTATAGVAQATLAWTAPVNNGGSAITDYLIEYKLSASSTWGTFVDDVSTLTTDIVTALTSGSSYDFRVSAINAIGTGTVSSTATATPTAAASSSTSNGNRRGVPVAFVSRPAVVVPETPRTGTGLGLYVSPIDGTLKACPAMTANLSRGARTNTAADVKLWQAILNKDLGLKIPINGTFGPMTLAATKSFQQKYRSVILDPQGIKNPTGSVASGTRAQANVILGCK